MNTYELGMYPLGDNALMLSDAQALPSSTNVDSTNTIDLQATNIQHWKTVLAVLIDLAFTNGSNVVIKVLQSDNDSDWDADYWNIVLPAETYAERIGIALLNPKRYIKLNYVTEENLSANTITAQLSSLVM